MGIPSLLAGTVYNLREDDLENESQFLNLFFGNDKRVNKDFVHPIECDRSLQPTNVLLNWATKSRPGTVKDPNMESLGHFELAQIGGTQTTAFAAYKMYVDYDVELLQPIVRTSPQIADHIEVTTYVSGDMFNGTLQTTSSSYGALEKMYSIALNVITFDPSVYGSFEIEYDAYYSSATAITGATWTFGGNASGILMNNLDGAATVSTFGSTVGLGISRVCAKIVGGGTLTMANASSANWVRADVFINSINNLTN
jgi:hypothetical protein